MTDVVDQELDKLISRRASQDKTPTEDERNALWTVSLRAYRARQRREARAAWFAHFCLMADNHARIAEDYERRAEELCGEGPA